MKTILGFYIFIQSDFLSLCNNESVGVLLLSLTFRGLITWQPIHKLSSTERGNGDRATSYCTRRRLCRVRREEDKRFVHGVNTEQWLFENAKWIGSLKSIHLFFQVVVAQLSHSNLFLLPSCFSKCGNKNLATWQIGCVKRIHHLSHV